MVRLSLRVNGHTVFDPKHENDTIDYAVFLIDKIAALTGGITLNRYAVATRREETYQASWYSIVVA